MQFSFQCLTQEWQVLVVDKRDKKIWRYFDVIFFTFERSVVFTYNVFWDTLKSETKMVFFTHFLSRELSIPMIDGRYALKEVPMSCLLLLTFLRAWKSYM